MAQSIGQGANCEGCDMTNIVHIERHRDPERVAALAWLRSEVLRIEAEKKRPVLYLVKTKEAE